MHNTSQLNSMSLWCELYPVISADQRFHNMLGQSGSTPLDLFKFYVEGLKARFSEEKALIKEIIKDKNFEVEVSTSYEAFQKVVAQDERAAAIDSGNMKLSFNSLMEKAELKEKERLREEARKRKRLESGFKGLLRQLAPPVDPTSKWDDVRQRICDLPAFNAVTLEVDRVSIFNDYIKILAEACGHHHGQTKKKKKKEKKAKKKVDKDKERDKGGNSDSRSSVSDEEVRRKEEKEDKQDTEGKEKNEVKEKKKKKHKQKDKELADGESGGKKQKKKRKRKHSAVDTEEAEEILLPNEKKSKRKSAGADKESIENSEKKESRATISLSEDDMSPGELSESELELRRKELLRELQEED